MAQRPLRPELLAPAEMVRKDRRGYYLLEDAPNRFA
jgi:hypothetical protein